MAKLNGKFWDEAAVCELRKLAAENMSTRAIALKLGFSPTAVSAKAYMEGISLKPTNESTYERASVVTMRRRHLLKPQFPLS